MFVPNVSKAAYLALEKRLLLSCVCVKIVSPCCFGTCLPIQLFNSHKENTMKHYEIVILFHPNQSERVMEMLARYTSQITDQFGGSVFRVQDLERKKLHYTIKAARTAKAHFAVMNVQCSQ